MAQKTTVENYVYYILKKNKYRSCNNSKFAKKFKNTRI